MIKLCAAELSNIGLSPFMFGMASAALTRANVEHMTVKSRMAAHVGCNFLVTI